MLSFSNGNHVSLTMWPSGSPMLVAMCPAVCPGSPRPRGLSRPNSYPLSDFGNARIVPSRDGRLLRTASCAFIRDRRSGPGYEICSSTPSASRESSAINSQISSRSAKAAGWRTKPLTAAEIGLKVAKVLGLRCGLKMRGGGRSASVAIRFCQPSPRSRRSARSAPGKQGGSSRTQLRGLAAGLGQPRLQSTGPTRKDQ